MTYAETYGQPTADGSHRFHIRCGDCGQAAVETEDGYVRCPDAVRWGACGNDPLTAERRDGPRYCEAIRGGREMRRRAFGEHGRFADGHFGTGAYLNERLVGMPEQWSEYARSR